MRRTILLCLAASVAVVSSASGSEQTAPGVIGADSLSTTVTSAEIVSATRSAPTTTAAAPTTSTGPATSTTTTSTSTTTTSTTISTTSTSTTTVAPTTPAPSAVDGGATSDERAVFDLSAAQVAVGTSVQGRPITAERYGTPGGRRVLVIGVIHGNEDAGIQIVDDLRLRAVPDGIELWLIEAMNPDGYANQVRQNANQVDLNRNFPYKWGMIGAPGDSQYAGTGPASEPETQAMVDFISQLRPDIAIWYHQDANLVIPSTGRDGRIRARYAELTGLPIATCCDGGGIYTGIAATWARNELTRDSESVAFIVELPGGELTGEQVEAHANAVLTVAAEG